MRNKNKITEEDKKVNAFMAFLERNEAAIWHIVRLVERQEYKVNEIWKLDWIAEEMYDRFLDCPKMSKNSWRILCNTTANGPLTTEHEKLFLKLSLDCNYWNKMSKREKEMIKGWKNWKL